MHIFPIPPVSLWFNEDHTLIFRQIVSRPLNVIRENKEGGSCNPFSHFLHCHSVPSWFARSVDRVGACVCDVITSSHMNRYCCSHFTNLAKSSLALRSDSFP